MTHRPRILNPVLNLVEASVNKTAIALCGQRVLSEDLTPTDFECPQCQALDSDETDDLADDIAELFKPNS